MATTTITTTFLLLSPCCINNIILLLLSLSLFPFIIHGYGAMEKEKHTYTYTYTQQLIHKTCRNLSATDSLIDYAFCTSALQARPARQCATLRRIGWTCIELTMINVTDTRRHIRNVVKGGEVKRCWLRRCVDECYEHYGNAISFVGYALRYYRHKKYVDAMYQLSSVITDVTLCEDLFVEGSRGMQAGGCGGGFSPFSARNNATIQLSAMALSVSHLIQEGN